MNESKHEITPAVREVLACPKCRGPLLDAENGPALDCRKCLLRYPIRGGLPVLLIESAVGITL